MIFIEHVNVSHMMHLSACIVIRFVAARKRSWDEK